MTHVAEALSWLRHDLAVVIGIMTPRSESCIGLCIYPLKTSSPGLIALTEMLSKRERKKDVILHSCSIATKDIYLLSHGLGSKLRRRGSMAQITLLYKFNSIRFTPVQYQTIPLASWRLLQSSAPHPAPWKSLGTKCAGCSPSCSTSQGRCLHLAFLSRRARQRASPRTCLKTRMTIGVR